MNEPDTEIKAPNSPSDCITNQRRIPTTEKQIRRPAGPAVDRPVPIPTKYPGPITPPMAIIICQNQTPQFSIFGKG